MAAAGAQHEGKEFKFPDEQNEGKENKGAQDEIQIDVIDDTPEQDRGRAPMKTPVEEPTDEELAQYGEKVQKRLKELTRARHDERRAKEQTERERDEAARAARELLEENKRLKQHVHKGETAFASTAKAAAEAEVESAKIALKKAHDEFDTDGIVAAQEKLTEAKLKLDRALSFRPTPLQEEKEQVQDGQQQRQGGERTEARPDPKAEAWKARNEWFGSDDEMTAVALAAHRQLVLGGIDPRSDEYYTALDARVKKRFPERFEEERRDNETDRDDAAGRREVQREKPRSVVAPVTRSQSPRRVKLTQSQLNIAARLGLTPEQYAKEIVKLEATNG